MEHWTAGERSVTTSGPWLVRRRLLNSLRQSMEERMAQQLVTPAAPPYPTQVAISAAG